MYIINDNGVNTLRKQDLNLLGYFIIIALGIAFLPYVIVIGAIILIVKLIVKLCKNQENVKVENYSTKNKNSHKVVPSLNNSNVDVILTLNERKHSSYVKAHSNMFKKIVSLNQEYSFAKLYPQNYTEICNSLRAYRQIDADQYLREKIKENLWWYKEEVERAEDNLCLWNNYQKEYKKLEVYLTKEEIKNLPERKMLVRTFQKIEKKLYQITQLHKPSCEVVLSVYVSYTSPQGRNSYNKSAKLTHREIRELLPEIEEELLEKEKILTDVLEQKRKEKLEKEAEKLLKEEERQKLRKKREEERAKERKEILEYRERIRAEERLILAEHTAAQNKKIYKKLKAQEEYLEKREEEFKAATQGHIYSLEHSNSSLVQEECCAKENSEELSTWVKLKRLKSQFDNGEISHIEYEEKRKKLL